MDNSTIILAASVDRLAILLAQIKELTTEADAIKSALISAGPDVIEGTLHRATIVHSIRTSIDSAAVKERFPEVFATCSKTSPTHSVRVTGRG